MPRTRIRGLGEKRPDKAVGLGASTAGAKRGQKTGHATGAGLDLRPRALHRIESRAGGSLFDEQGLVDIERTATALRMSKTQLA